MPSEREKTRRWQFSLRELCFCTVIVAVATAWWLDRGGLVRKLESQAQIIKLMTENEELRREGERLDEEISRINHR